MREARVMPGKMEPRPKPGVYSTGRLLPPLLLEEDDSVKASSSDEPTYN